MKSKDMLKKGVNRFEKKRPVAWTSTIIPEVIRVPAGESRDVIKTVVTIPGGKLTAETYLAPGVGLVKEIRKNEFGNVVYVLELLEYELKKPID
jgi:hypothetical protein